jgi:hypothetical protein
MNKYQILGIVITIVGWLIDNSHKFPFFNKIFHGNNQFCLDMLRKLTEDEKMCLTLNNDSRLLSILNHWPQLDKSSIKITGRSITVINVFNMNGKDFQLIAYN